MKRAVPWAPLSHAILARRYDRLHLPQSPAERPRHRTALFICGVPGELHRPAVLHRYLTQLPARFEAAKGWVELRAVVVDVDEETGRARSIKRLTEV
jgi:hypothetical protein